MISTDYGLVDKPLYRLESLLGVEIEGFFYRQELIPAPDLRNEDFFVVDAIHESRTRNGDKEYMVSYLGYDSSFDRWIKEKDLLK